MKEKDLEKNLDNLIINGLIKEAEQDNADFEVAMLHMSDEEFAKIVKEPSTTELHHAQLSTSFSHVDECKVFPSIVLKATIDEDNEVVLNNIDGDVEVTDKAAEHMAEGFAEPAPLPLPAVKKKNLWRSFRPWISAAITAAAVVLIVLIPSINTMNGKLCDAALYASAPYITANKGEFDVSSVSIDELKTELPALEARYKESIKEYGKFSYYTDDLRVAGWDLTVAYLKLHKKRKAVEILKVLTEQYKDTTFGNHCKTILQQLD